MNESNQERISDQDYQLIQDAKKQLAYSKLSTEHAELQLKNLLLQTYLKNGLSLSDSIDNDGNIIRAKQNTKEANEESPGTI